MAIYFLLSSFLAGVTQSASGANHWGNRWWWHHQSVLCSKLSTGEVWEYCQVMSSILFNYNHSWCWWCHQPSGFQHRHNFCMTSHIVEASDTKMLVNITHGGETLSAGRNFDGIKWSCVPKDIMAHYLRHGLIFRFYEMWQVSSPLQSLYNEVRKLYLTPRWWEKLSHHRAHKDDLARR